MYRNYLLDFIIFVLSVGISIVMMEMYLTNIVIVK